MGFFILGGMDKIGYGSHWWRREPVFTEFWVKDNLFWSEAAGLGGLRLPQPRKVSKIPQIPKIPNNLDRATASKL